MGLIFLVAPGDLREFHAVLPPDNCKLVFCFVLFCSSWLKTVSVMNSIPYTQG